MKRILIAAMVAASLVAASRASAADLPVPAGRAPAYYPVATVYDWGGGYVGINGGYATGQSEWGGDPLNPSGLGSTGNFHVNGGLVGATIGVSGQWGAWVFGVEGDFDWQGISGSSGSAFCTSIFASPNPGSPPRRIELQDREQLAGNGFVRGLATPGTAFSFTGLPAAPAPMSKRPWPACHIRGIPYSAGPPGRELK
jgi:opacity protein-like surface antigen